MANELTNEARIRIAEEGAGVREITEEIKVSGGPIDDALSAEVLAGEEDIQVSQDALYVADAEEVAK